MRKIVENEGFEKGKKEGLDEGEKIGVKKGRKEGISEGAKGKALEMAKAMKEEGEPLEKISKFTGLSKEEIEKL